MKKFLTLICAFVMALTACAGLVACGGNGDGDNGGVTPPPAPAPAGPTSLTYTSLGNQYDTLTEVLNEGADIAVVEKAVFNYWVKSEVNDSLMIVAGDQFVFEKEEYVMACKQGTDVAEYFNAAMYYLQENSIEINGTNVLGEVDWDIADIASFFNLSESLITIQKPSVVWNDEPALNSEFSRILVDGFNVGFVVDTQTRHNFNHPFAGLSHFGGHEGFETMITRGIARLYGKTNTTANEKFVNYEDAKDALANGTVDVLVGGFSTEDWGTGFDFTVPYFSNSHVLVIRKEDASKYNSFSKMKNAQFIVASNSKGEALVKTGAIKTAVLG